MNSDYHSHILLVDTDWYNWKYLSRALKIFNHFERVILFLVFFLRKHELWQRFMQLILFKYAVYTFQELIIAFISKYREMIKQILAQAYEKHLAAISYILCIFVPDLPLSQNFNWKSKIKTIYGT